MLIVVGGAFAHENIIVHSVVPFFTPPRQLREKSAERLHKRRLSCPLSLAVTHPPLRFHCSYERNLPNDAARADFRAAEHRFSTWRERATYLSADVRFSGLLFYLDRVRLLWQRHEWMHSLHTQLYDVFAWLTARSHNKHTNKQTNANTTPRTHSHHSLARSRRDKLVHALRVQRHHLIQVQASVMQRLSELSPPSLVCLFGDVLVMTMIVMMVVVGNNHQREQLSVLLLHALIIYSLPFVSFFFSFCSLTQTLAQLRAMVDELVEAEHVRDVVMKNESDSSVREVALQ